MSKRTERRAAERAARKVAFKELRAKQAQSNAVANTVPTNAAEPQPQPTAPTANQDSDLLARAQAFFKTTPAPEPQTETEPEPAKPTGRAISAQNALKHGSCADTLILKHENPADYENLRTMWLQSYQPQDRAEAHLIQQLINADWFHQRATRNANHVEADLLEAEPDPSKWTEQQHRTLARFLRYQTTRANAMHKARKAVEDYRRARAKETAAREKPQTTRKSKAEEPFDIQKLIADMTNTATALGYRNPDGTKKS